MDEWSQDQTCDAAGFADSTPVDAKFSRPSARPRGISDRVPRSSSHHSRLFLLDCSRHRGHRDIELRRSAILHLSLHARPTNVTDKP